MIDSKLQEQLHKKYNPEGSLLRKAQLRMVKMLVFLDDVCTKYDLRYWLDSGTLLGACRHGGFIPWDDDTDVCMPLEDLRKLKKIMASERLSNEFVLQTPEDDKNYIRLDWCVLRDLKSEYFQESEYHRHLKYRGLQIDIFPVERGIRPVLKKIVVKSYCDWIFTDLVMKSKLPYNLSFKIAKVAQLFTGKIMIPFFRLFNRKDADYYSFSFGVNFFSRRYLKNIYPLKKISFEGHLLNAPQKPDPYLTDIYGDWRKIPSESDIVTHNAKFKFYE